MPRVELDSESTNPSLSIPATSLELCLAVIGVIHMHMNMCVTIHGIRFCLP